MIDDRWSIIDSRYVSRYFKIFQDVSRCGFSISCGSRWMRRRCLSFSKTAQHEDWEMLSDSNRKWLHNQFQNSAKYDIHYWVKIVEFSLIHKIFEMHVKKIEAQLTGDRSVFKIQVLNNRGLISSLQHPLNLWTHHHRRL
jgi:hypothetical protein